MEARDFYIKVTDKKGASSIRQHRVWNAEAFLSSQQKQYVNDKENPCTVEVSTEAAYKAQRAAGKGN